MDGVWGEPLAAACSRAPWRTRACRRLELLALAFRRRAYPASAAGTTPSAGTGAAPSWASECFGADHGVQGYTTAVLKLCVGCRTAALLNGVAARPTARFGHRSALLLATRASATLLFASAAQPPSLPPPRKRRGVTTVRLRRCQGRPQRRLRRLQGPAAIRSSSLLAFLPQRRRLPQRKHHVRHHQLWPRQRGCRRARPPRRGGKPHRQAGPDRERRAQCRPPALPAGQLAPGERLQRCEHALCVSDDREPGRRRRARLGRAVEAVRERDERQHRYGHRERDEAGHSPRRARHARLRCRSGEAFCTTPLLSRTTTWRNTPTAQR